MAVLYVIYLNNQINRPICPRRYQIAPCITRAYNKHALRLIASYLLSCLPRLVMPPRVFQACLQAPMPTPDPIWNACSDPANKHKANK